MASTILYAEALTPDVVRAAIRQLAGRRRARAGRAGPSPTTTRRASPRAGGRGATATPSSRHGADAADEPARQRHPLSGRGAGPAPGRCAVRASAGPRGDRQLAADAGPRRRAHADAVAVGCGAGAASRRASPGCPSIPATSPSPSTGRRATRARCSSSPAGWSRCAARGPALRTGAIRRVEAPMPCWCSSGARGRGAALRLQPRRGIGGLGPAGGLADRRAGRRADGAAFGVRRRANRVRKVTAAFPSLQGRGQRCPP